MKHRGPGASLQPSRETARANARAMAAAQDQAASAARVATQVRATVAGLEAGGWRLTTNDDGDLCAVHEPTGYTAVLATLTRED